MTGLARLLAGRLAVASAMLALLSAIVYLGTDLLPGDPATARAGSLGAEQVERLRAALGLDRPLADRYAEWLTGFVRGDLGTSASGRPVGELLGERLGNSVLLAALTLAIVIPASLAVGVAAGLRRDGATDRIASTGMLLLVALPEFVLAGSMVLLFAVGLGWLPALSLVPAGASPLSVPEVLVLPVISLALPATAYTGRVMRAATAAAARAPHVEFLRLNGAKEGSVVRQAILPAVLPAALQVWLVGGVALVGGAVLVEKVFGYPGIGGLLVSAVQTGDLPVVQAMAMILGASMLVAMLVADLATHLLTPTLRTAVR